MAFLWQQFKQLCKLHMETLIVTSRKLIHNEVAKARDEFLDGLYELLEGANWYLRVLSNDSGEVKCVFVAIPSSVAFARRYPYIMMMDCT